MWTGFRTVLLLLFLAMFSPVSISVALIVCLSQKQRPKRVKAIYNCVADNPDELTFSEGELIVVDGEEDQEWWVSISTCGCVLAFFLITHVV